MSDAADIAEDALDLRPRCVLRVGVVGHRPNRIAADAFPRIDAALSQAFDRINAALSAAHSASRRFFRDEAPLLSCVNGLAEGADTWAARRALATGAELIAIVPFSRDEYAKDFTSEAAVDEYRSLLSASAATIELPGERADNNRAYRASSDVLLDQADLLISVWDGGASAGAGGTRDALDEAARRGLPIVNIDATSGETAIYWREHDPRNHHIRNIEDITPSKAVDQITGIISALLSPPLDEKERVGLTRYLRSAGGETPGRPEWRFFMRAIAGAHADSESNVATSPPDSAVKSPHRRRLLAMYAVADRRAAMFAESFRSAYALNFVLAASAVVVAVLPLFPLLARIPKPVFLIAELLILLGIWRNTTKGRRAQLHSRWLESRELAERLRPAPVFWRLATRGRRNHARERTWTGWYAQAMMREATPWSGRIDVGELKSARAAVNELARSQQRYHESAVRRHRHLEEKLELIGHGAFRLTFAIAFALLCAWPFLGPDWRYALALPATGLAAALPAIGSALYGLRLIGDFRSITERSTQVARDLDKLAALIERDDTDFEHLRQIALALADSMLGEVASWRLSAESRPLDLPN